MPYSSDLSRESADTVVSTAQRTRSAYTSPRLHMLSTAHTEVKPSLHVSEYHSNSTNNASPGS
jgi:hypothetical protein